MPVFEYCTKFFFINYNIIRKIWKVSTISWFIYWLITFLLFPTSVYIIGLNALYCEFTSPGLNYNTNYGISFRFIVVTETNLKLFYLKFYDSFRNFNYLIVGSCIVYCFLWSITFSVFIIYGGLFHEYKTPLTLYNKICNSYISLYTHTHIHIINGTILIFSWEWWKV